MKLFCLCLLLACVAAQVHYDRRYDYFDIDSLIQNRRLLAKYMNCFLDKGPCPPIGRVFKARLPELIATGCAKCTPRQKALARKAFEAFKKYLPESHKELMKKIDPQNKFYGAFEKAIAAF